MSSKNQIKSLKTLIKVRERQGKRLEEAVNEAKAQLKLREDELQNTIAEHEQSIEDEKALGQERLTLQSSAFSPDDVRSLDFKIDDKKAQIKQLEKSVEERRKSVERHIPMVHQAQAAVRRNEQRIESFQERIKKVMNEREAAMEEVAEEETEEASTARFVARIRAAKEAQT